ncbi:MAG: hypothetical protein KDI13_03525 [Alphaproteobacteria bacterium]|nr:hypothetical protein [Alphaproteobacteria bacterium]
MEKDFNKTQELSRFIHKRNPFVPHAWQIMELKHKGLYEPVGEYILINTDEDPEITEKKVINLITLLNRKKDLIDLSNLTKTRILFTVVPEAQSGDQTKIIFKDYDGSGVSKENAIFTIRKGVLHGNIVNTRPL